LSITPHFTPNNPEEKKPAIKPKILLVVAVGRHKYNLSFPEKITFLAKPILQTQQTAFWRNQTSIVLILV
jgi:hypothetical protein